MIISIKDRIFEKEFQEKILLSLANGYSYKEIKQQLNLSDYEMRFCSKFLYEKYRANNKPSLVYNAICAGDIDLCQVKAWVEK